MQALALACCVQLCRAGGYFIAFYLTPPLNRVLSSGVLHEHTTSGQQRVLEMGCVRVVQRGCDLTSLPRKSLLRLLAEHCTEPREKHHLLLLCSRDGRETYTKVRASPPP